LEEEIHRRTETEKQLQQATEKAIQAMKNKANFLSTISHEYAIFSHIFVTFLAGFKDVSIILKRHIGNKTREQVQYFVF
jgi:hypothetical protein